MKYTDEPKSNQTPIQTSHSNQEIVNTSTILELSPDDFPGGIAMWGALPAVYNTSIAPDERGVHVHAREKVGGHKQIDETFEFVRVKLRTTMGQVDSFVVNGQDAARYNIASIFHVALSYEKCPHCSHIHSDDDFDLVHPHEEHTCELCGHIWRTERAIVSNPVMLLKECCGDALQNRTIIDPVERTMQQPQTRFPGGIQIWGSNPAVVWTSSKYEEGGLHFHAFTKRTNTPDVDETYGRVELDGINLDAEQVRHIMAQRALPFLKNRVVDLSCPSCGSPHFDRFEKAVTPHIAHQCEECGHEFQAPNHSTPVVSNPIISLLKQLEHNWQNQSNL